ncbi:MAG: hypothetical protein ACK4VW_08770 [Anaerolineales bacterium]
MRLLTTLILLLLSACLATPSVSIPPSLTSPAPPTPLPLRKAGTPPAARPTITPTATLLPNPSIPQADPYDLTCRLKGLCDLSRFLPSDPFEVGAKKSFWVLNSSTYQTVSVNAILRAAAPHVYFWIEEGIPYSENALTSLVEAFERKIYPTTRAAFGSEWTPGVDNDPHIFILYTKAAGRGVAGYFSSADELNPQIHPYSNAHEMFVLNADVLPLSSPFTAATLAHEFQHMIHWNMDRSESTWINEGLGVLSETINGYANHHASIFLYSPDLNLTGWGETPAQSGAHYMQAYLFLRYLAERLGIDFLRALVANPADGLESIDETLREQHRYDPLRQRQLTADDLFLDWAAALYLDDPSLADGRYAHPESGTPLSETISTCPVPAQSRTVEQYGLDYITITCSGNYTLHFEGAIEGQRFPVVSHSGRSMFWSGEGNIADMRLTRAFDLTDASPPITLSYWTWFDLEENFDYAYLEVSQDGQRWEILRTPSATDQNPVGNAYGWGYNGKSDGWIQESIDLSAFAGKKIWLRFEYITDDVITGVGLLLDDIRLPALGYQSDFEQDDGGWQAEGFRRVENYIPQPFRLLWIVKGENTSIQEISLSSTNTADIPFTLAPGEQATLLVTATSRQTHLPAEYTWWIR